MTCQSNHIHTYVHRHVDVHLYNTINFSSYTWSHTYIHNLNVKRSCISSLSQTHEPQP